ncbi:MAG: xanthine dehydrogenase family protein molybdopterin-binding subunit [SAR202 cluster bacterium]|nr:xanthine dehydrogenase family protein molybdopterin-binding subunit [SAR202 cluster bacterium]MQF68592.1 xanthine dehydrogenase family protein molybdopterin-binding subunit [SAR202 cluster bacterium AD-802-K11_MRT_200m]
MTTAAFGSALKRKEDPRLITGQGTYVEDVSLTGMLHIVLVRSPLAHASIKSIDSSEASKSPGVVAIFTGEDLKEELGSLPCGWVVPDTKEVPHPPLAVDRVRYVGDAVVAVVAESTAQASDAASLVDVEYEELDTVIEMDDALADGAVQLHEDAPNNTAFEWEVDAGSISDARSSSDVAVTQRFVNQRLIPTAMENRGVVVDYNSGTDQITMWTSTQIPHLIRVLLALVTGHPEHLIRVIAPDVGGAFGSKLYLYAEEVIAPIIAKNLKRPVKWVESRSEGYLATTHGRDHITDIEIIGNRDGTITGLDVRTLANMGAYLSTFAPLIPTWLYGLMLSGPYKIPNIYCKVIAPFTNTTPVDAYRGAGRPEATYAVERAVDLFAQEIGMDPAEVRKINFIPPFEDGYEVATTVSYDSGNYIASFERALEMVGYTDFRKEQQEARDKGKLLGIGLSAYVEICGAAPSAVAGTLGARAGLWESANVRIHMTGKVSVFTGASSHGQGHETAFAQLVSSELGIPVEDIDVIHGDTSQIQMGTGSFGSRSAAVGGGAIHMSTQKIKEKAKKLAAHILEASEEDIEFEDGKLFVRGAPAEGKTIQEIALASYYYTEDIPEGMEPGMEAMSFFDPKNFTWPGGTHIAVVEIEEATGEVTLLRYIAVDDVGNVINPLIVDGMVHGGAAQGVGQALQEEAIYDGTGQLLTGSMMDYAVPRATDLPMYELDRTVTPTPVNPMGVKGAGETATIAGSPAVINAVVDALSPYGVKHIDMPAKAEKVWRIIRDSKV